MPRLKRQSNPSQVYQISSHRGKRTLEYRDDKTRKRIRISLGTDDLGLAEQRAREMWAMLHNPKSERVSDIWCLYKADRNSSGVIIDRAGSTWKALEPSFGHKIGSAINRDDCRKHYEKRKKENRSDSTIRTELELLRACLNFYYGKEKSPSLWVPPASRPREHYLKREELDMLLIHTEAPHVRLFIILAITTGARMSALLELRWEMVDLEHGTINLNPAGRVITNKRRTVVPINTRARSALTGAKESALSDYVIEYGGKPIKTIRKAIERAQMRSGVRVSPHVFRHTAGVWMAQADVPMQKISQFLGHTSSRVTEQVYARYSPSFMKDAAAALDW